MQKDLKYFWGLKKFQPNKEQEKAILHVDGPLFLTAGPGSGKTRVLLWRTLNLIVFQDVDPKSIFLATFTEKAAHQLKEGLMGLLGLVTNETGVSYDISGMAIGTVHSICQDVLADRDRRFSVEHEKSRAPVLWDSLTQYFKVYRRLYWLNLLEKSGFITEEDYEDEYPEKRAQEEINRYLSGQNFYSRHLAATSVIGLFNRFSEENLDPDGVKASDETLQRLLRMYAHYKQGHVDGLIKTVDFSLLQQQAYDKIRCYDGAKRVFQHIIVDEYQDTNSIQESLYFELAKGYKNICVVGDDDQALYRFRGATVENLVEFETRCELHLGRSPVRINLNTNYRSKKKIVEFYTEFIEKANWKKFGTDQFYRVQDKQITSFNTEKFPAIAVTDKNSKVQTFAEVADFVLILKEQGKIEDYNQVAFLFPSLAFRGEKNGAVQGYEEALNALGIKVYAPRAGRFLELPEAIDVFGLIFSILGRPSHQGPASGGFAAFRQWQLDCIARADELMAGDSLLKDYVNDRCSEIKTVSADYEVLIKVVERKKWFLDRPFKQDMLRDLASASGLSEKCKSVLQKRAFTEMIKKREQAKQPVSLSYVINRVTSLDWSVLDLFYQLNGFKHFQEMYALAEDGTDEGPVCNLGMITQYLARFTEEYTAMITASFLSERRFANTFVGSYLYAIYRLGESEFEDSDDPFPKGRVPFLTIHQSKGLEFPYVILGGLNKKDREADMKEVIIRQLLGKEEGEPLDKISLFDSMRMFYVALSRAQVMTILPAYSRQHRHDAFKAMLDNNTYPTLSTIDLSSLPASRTEADDIGKSYSYTGDYLNYQQCPRKYMIFKKYGFIPSRSQTMFFGSLVHQTIEDLHHLLISNRKSTANSNA